MNTTYKTLELRSLKYTYKHNSILRGVQSNDTMAGSEAISGSRPPKVPKNKGSQILNNVIQVWF